MMRARRSPRRYASLTEDQIIIRIANAKRRMKLAGTLETVSADIFVVQELQRELELRARKNRRVA